MAKPNTKKATKKSKMKRIRTRESASNRKIFEFWGINFPKYLNLWAQYYSNGEKGDSIKLGRKDNDKCVTRHTLAIWSNLYTCA